MKILTWNHEHRHATLNVVAKTDTLGRSIYTIRVTSRWIARIRRLSILDRLSMPLSMVCEL